MAFIGLRYPVVATLNTHTDGSAPTYNTGMVIGHAIQANLTITRNDNPLYADDRIVEDDNGVTGMSIELGLDDLADTVQAYMLGVKAGTGQDPAYSDTDEGAPTVGFGYIRVRRKNGVTSYQATWYYKATFGQTDETAQTKGESIEWQTPTITGRVQGTAVDASGALTYRIRKEFATEEEAKTYLDGLANL